MKPELTRRELAIVHLITEGKSNAEIGEVLGLTANTVRIQAHALLKKVGTKSRVVLAVRAVREGWINSDRAPARKNLDEKLEKSLTNFP